MTPAELDRVLTSSPSGIRLTCRIQPRASRNAIVGLYGDAVKIALTAPPVEGKANAALCAFFSELFHCPKSAVCVVSGTTSKNKMIQVDRVSRETACTILCKT